MADRKILTMMDKFVFFDFDGTIIRNDSFIEFAKSAVGLHRFCYSLMRSSPWLIAWKLGMISNSSAKQRLFRMLFRGFKLSDFHKECDRFSATIDHYLRPDAMEALAWHKSHGHRIVIVSASVADWIRPWANAHGIGQVIATTIETDANRDIITGRFSSPNCYGQEKVVRILNEIPDLSATESWAYSDSESDAPLLALVTHGIRI